MARLLSQRRTLVMIVLLLLLSSLLPARISTRIGSIPRGAVTLMLSPFTAPLKSLSNSLRGGADEPLEVGSDQDLKLQLGQALVVIEQLEQQLAAAEQQIALLTQTDAIAMEGTRRIMARVMSYSSDRLRPKLTIDRGTAKGIRTGAPVVYGVNLVGLVDNAYPATADIDPVTSAGTRFQVRLRSPEVSAGPGDVTEMAVLSDDRSHFVVQLRQDDPVDVGDWAHLADNRWPPEAQGWVVGKVTQMRDDPQNQFLFKRAIITPMQPVHSLSRVTVIVPTE